MNLNVKEVACWIEVNTRAYNPTAGIQQFALNSYQRDLLAEICRFNQIIKTKERQVGCSLVLQGFALYMSAVHHEVTAYYHRPGVDLIKREMRRRNSHLPLSVLDRVIFCKSFECTRGLIIDTIISDDHDIFDYNLCESLCLSQAHMIGKRGGRQNGRTIVTITGMPEMIKGQYARDLYGAP